MCQPPSRSSPALTHSILLSTKSPFLSPSCPLPKVSSSPLPSVLSAITQLLKERDADRQGQERCKEIVSGGAVTSKTQRKERKKTLSLSLPPTPNQTKTCIYIVSIQPCLLVPSSLPHSPALSLSFSQSHTPLCSIQTFLYHQILRCEREQNFSFWVIIDMCLQIYKEPMHKSGLEDGGDTGQGVVRDVMHLLH